MASQSRARVATMQPSSVSLSTYVRWCLVGAVLALGWKVAQGLLSDLLPGSSAAAGSEPEDAFFSVNYWEARERFRHEARAIGAELSAHVVHADPRTGLEYTMDVAVVRGTASDAEDCMLLHLSGVHGAEGFAGSAIQIAALHALRGRTAGQLPCTLVFVHAVNPYGFAELRRFNENNVDLNRNALSAEEWKVVRSRDANIAGYESFKSLLQPTGLNWYSQWTLLLRAAWPLLTHGIGTLKKAIVTGQYHEPRGVYYGGAEDQPSHLILREVLKPFRNCKKVLVVDVHSGLGPSGADTIMVDEADRLLVARYVGKTAYSVESTVSSADGASAGYDLAMGTDSASNKFSDATRVVSMTQEFGTLPGVLVARAVILENVAHQHHFGSDLHMRMKTLVKNAFYVQTPAWKRSVLARGATVLQEAIDMIADRSNWEK